MPDLAIEIRGADAVRNAAGPAIAFDLELAATPPAQPVQTVLLNCQIHIEAQRRRYAAAEQTRLRDVFGEPERWGQTLRPLLWANVTTTVPGFSGSIGVKLAVPCTIDFEVTATKYFYAVDAAAVPVSLLFSGTVFYRNDANQLQASPIPWNTEAHCALPASLWKECIDLHHPNTARLELRRDVFQRIYEFKVRHGLATFDEALERMLDAATPTEARWTAP